MPEQATPEQIFSVLSDRHSLGIMKMAYSGFRASSSVLAANLSKKQFYMRLKKLRDLGFIEKKGFVLSHDDFWLARISRSDTDHGGDSGQLLEP